jgi:hypothetical protein
MRYTAVAVILFGVLVACYAGFRYASGGPPDQVVSPSAASLAGSLALAALLVIGGVAMWVFGGEGYTTSGPVSVRRP